MQTHNQILTKAYYKHGMAWKVFSFVETLVLWKHMQNIQTLPSF